MKTLNVVCAIIRNSKGEYLLAQRSENMPHSGFWEFAGGKVEQGESHVQALKREIREELGCEIKTGLYFGFFYYDYGNIQVAIHAYFACLNNNIPTPIEHDDLKWIKLRDIVDSHNLLESNRQIVKRLVEVKRG